MTETVFSLSLGLVIIACVTYGLTAIVKPFIPSNWRKSTALGKASMMAIPLVIGGVLSCLSVESLVELVSGLTGGPKDLGVSWAASFVLGMFSGSFATQIHSAVRHKVRLAAAKAIDKE
tara:strand:+ start:10433 stop:10789 length:357 start_codon:yes stop_codon:yes gene_type:complete